MAGVSWNRAGVSLGVLFALMHTVWILLVEAGLSTPVIRVMAQAHFIGFQYVTLPPDLMTAILGLFGAFASGYLIGAVFTIIWNVTGDYL